MWCVVYPLYRSGVRLPAEEAKAGGQRGWLVHRLKRPSNGMLYPHALLLPTRETLDLYPLLLLESPELQFINGGIRLIGKDWDAEYRHIKQAWWIVPAEAPT